MAISWNDHIKIVNGKKIVLCSTIRLEVCCDWKDDSTSWKKLSDLKDSHPLQFAEFALSVGIANEPAFDWWVTWVLKKRDCIISLVNCQST